LDSILSGFDHILFHNTKTFFTVIVSSAGGVIFLMATTNDKVVEEVLSFPADIRLNLVEKLVTGP
jgi:hypothetical protein